MSGGTKRRGAAAAVADVQDAGAGAGTGADEYDDDGNLDILVKRTKFRPSALSGELSRYMGDPQFENRLIDVSDGGVKHFAVPTDTEAGDWAAIPKDKQAALVRDVVRAIALRAHAGLGEFDRSVVINIIKNRAVKLKAP